jgi:hypothetical protein
MEIKKRAGRKPKGTPVQQAEQVIEKPIETQNNMAENVDTAGMEDDDLPFSFESYSPIDEEVVERSYNKIEVDPNIGDIPEPDFGTGRPDFSDAESVEFEEAPKQGMFDNVKNPAMSELDPKDVKIATKQLVNSVLEGYEMLHQVGGKFAKINENKVAEKAMKGEIDLDLRVPIDAEGNDVNAMEYVQVHNQQAEEIFKYDPEFNDKVRPAMERIFAKKGWGITDEQFVLGMFAKDILTKGAIAFAFKKSGNEMIKHFVSNSQQIRASQMHEPPVERVTPDSIITPPKQEEPVTEMEVKVATAKVVSVEDIEAQMNED